MAKVIDNAEELKTPVKKAKTTTKTEDKKEASASTSLFDTNKFLKVFKWFIPALTVIVFMLINYAIKGIAPFGNNYVSYVDMQHHTVPPLYDFWDAIYTGDGMIYDFFLSGGTSTFGFTLPIAFSPLTWLVLLVPRSAISCFSGILLIIKMALMATTMYWFIRKMFKNTSHFIQLLYSVLWAFSGWMMVHFMNNMWLEVMILFPVLCYGIKNIFDGGKMLTYMLVLIFCLCFTFYLSYMLLLMVVFCGACAIFFSEKTKEEKKKIVSKLVVGSLLSLFISFLIFLPAVLQSLNSARIEGGSKAILYENTWSKAIILCMGTFIMFGFVKLLTKYKEDKNVVQMFIAMILFTTVTVLLERSNMMWHTGNYQSFPYRFSFIPIFIMMCAGLYYFDRHFKYGEKKKSDWTIYVLFGVVLIFLSLQFFNASKPAFIIDIFPFLATAICCAVGVFFLFRLFESNNRTLNIVFISILCVAEIFCNTHAYIGLAKKNDTNIAHDNYYQLSEDVKLPDDGYRYSTRLLKEDNLWATRYYNYSYCLDRPTLAGWQTLITTEQSQGLAKMGYYIGNANITGSGGNYFTNMVNNVKYVVSDQDLDDQLYKFIGKNDTYSVYEYRYTLPLGGVYKTEDLFEMFPEDAEWCESTNYIYNNMFNKTGDIITKIVPAITDTEDSKTYSLYVPANSILYAYSDRNEIECPMYKIGDEERIVYFRVNEIGRFDDETVELVFDKDKFDAFDSLSFAVMPVNKIEDIVNTTTVKTYDSIKYGKSSLKVTVDGQEGESLFIPYNYDKGWKAYVNGKEVKVNRALHTYMSVELEEGKNVVEFKFEPPYFKIGLIVSIVFLLLAIGLWVLNKYTKFTESKLYNSIFYWVGFSAFMALLIVIYIRPLAQTIIYLG